MRIPHMYAIFYLCVQSFGPCPASWFFFSSFCRQFFFSLRSSSSLSAKRTMPPTKNCKFFSSLSCSHHQMYREHMKKLFFSSQKHFCWALIFNYKSDRAQCFKISFLFELESLRTLKKYFQWITFKINSIY